MTQGQEKLILAAFEAGLKPAAIAREFRLSRARVDAVLADAGQGHRWSGRLTATTPSDARSPAATGWFVLAATRAQPTLFEPRARCA